MMKVLGCLFALVAASQAGFLGVGSGNSGGSYGGSYGGGNHGGSGVGGSDGGHSSVGPTAIKLIHSSEAEAGHSSSVAFGGNFNGLNGDLGGDGDVENVKIIKVISSGTNKNRHNYGFGAQGGFSGGHGSQVKIIKLIHDEGYGRFSGGFGDHGSYSGGHGGIISGHDSYSSGHVGAAPDVKIIKILSTGPSLGRHVSGWD